MKKEELALEHMKAVVLALKNEARAMKEDPDLFKRWGEKCDDVKEELGKLSDEEAKWFEKKYKKWVQDTFSKEIATMMLTIG